jgi:hypothetical protein
MLKLLGFFLNYKYVLLSPGWYYEQWFRKSLNKRGCKISFEKHEKARNCLDGVWNESLKYSMQQAKKARSPQGELDQASQVAENLCTRSENWVCQCWTWSLLVRRCRRNVSCEKVTFIHNFQTEKYNLSFLQFLEAKAFRLKLLWHWIKFRRTV